MKVRPPARVEPEPEPVAELEGEREAAAPGPASGAPDAKRGSGRFGATGGVRTRILASYLVLLVLSGVLSSVAIREVLLLSLADRVEGAVAQEVQEFNLLLTSGRDPQTGRRFASLQAVVDTFFARNVASRDEALIAFVEGGTTRSTLARFPVSQIPREITDRYGPPERRMDVTAPVSGQVDTELGPAYYRTLPLQLGGGTGVFIVVILPAQELAEIAALQVYGTAAVVLVLLVASACSWLVVRRALVPVRQLTDTAQQISLSDLSRRIEVRGSDESAEMASTFNAMLDRLERVLRSEREFVSDASHELRVPLTVCLGNLEVLGMGLAEEDLDRRRSIGLVIDEVERMARIVNDLRLLADRAQPDFAQLDPFDVTGFAEELVSKAQTLASRTWTVESSASASIVADRQRLTEAVMNLADNAVRHTVAEDTIGIGVDVSGDEVRIWVHDTGRGIPVTEQARIFDRFSRGGYAYRSYRGSGLGLAIVRAIAEVHGGRVALTSRVGEGSTFTLVFPRSAVVARHRSV